MKQKAFVYKIYLFQINAVLFNFLFIKESWRKITFSKNQLIIKNVSWAANQHMRMISEGSCDTEDWSNDAEIVMLRSSDLDELTETVTSYISVCEDICIPTRTFLSFNNDKPWFTGKLKQLRQAKEDAYRSGDKILYNQVRNRLTKEIRVAKKNYSEKLKKELSANQHFGISMDWSEEHHHVQDTTPTVCGESTTGWRSQCVLLPIWKGQTDTQHPLWSALHTFTLPPVTPLPPSPTILPALKVCVEDVNRVFRKQKSRKASGREGISPACLKVCADQLAPIFTQIFNRSLELCEVPCCFKRSTIIPVPKKPKITGLNDYRPVTLTSVVMKSLERLVLAYLKDIIRPLLDPLQFAYRANRSVDDAVNMGLHYILQHLDKPGNYARILFVDFSSALNTIMPDLLSDKLTQLSVPTSICQWIISFLTDRQQLVRLGKLTSRTLTISTGAPQVAFSPHCSSPSTPMTALQRTPLSSSWSLWTTLQSSASSRTVTSLLTDRRLSSWLSGAVLTWS